jgi:hypothetical protein
LFVELREKPFEIEKLGKIRSVEVIPRQPDYRIKDPFMPLVPG